MADSPKTIRETAIRLLALAQKTTDPLARDKFIAMAIECHERVLAIDGKSKPPHPQIEADATVAPVRT